MERVGHPVAELPVQPLRRLLRVVAVHRRAVPQRVEVRQPQLTGRRPADQVGGDDNVVVLSHAFWQRRFGGDPLGVGRPIILDARPMLVVGVMPRNFRIGDTEPDVIWPAGFDRERLTLAGSSAAI